MPIPPDPTHPKFLEGDEVLKPASAQEDDVQGHLKPLSNEEPSTGPEDLMRATDDEDGDDVEGHFRP